MKKIETFSLVAPNALIARYDAARPAFGDCSRSALMRRALSEWIEHHAKIPETRTERGGDERHE